MPDATSTVKGLVQLAGDLAGTSASPTVPGLAAKATDAAVVHLAGNETITGTKNFTGVLQAGGAAVVTGSDARLTDQRTPSDNTVTAAKLQSNSVVTAKVADDAITEPKLAVSNSPATNQVLAWNGTALAWATPASGGSGDPTMGGDLSGVASNAQITAGAVGTNELADTSVTAAKIANTTIVAGKIADDAITEAKLSVSNAPTNGHLLSYNGSNFTWVAAPTGGADPVMGGDISGNASNATIVAGSISTGKLADTSVTAAKIANTTITAAQIAATTITGAKIADDTITEPKLNVSNAPATNQVLTWNGTALAWTTPASGGGGGSQWTAQTITASTTVASGAFVIGNATSGGFTVTLPAAANGAYVTVKKLDNSVNAILVAPPSGTINAGSGTSSTISVNSYGMVADFIADGTQWHQVG